MDTTPSGHWMVVTYDWEMELLLQWQVYLKQWVSDILPLFPVSLFALIAVCVAVVVACLVVAVM